ANFDEGTIAAVDGKIINSGATVTEDNGNKVADLGGSAHMAITKTDGSPILKDLETAAIHIRAKATGSNKTDWYFFAAESAAAPSGGSEKYIGAFNNNAGVINFERYKGGRGNPGVTVTSAKNEWHDLDFLFNEKTMEIYVDGKFKKAQSHDDVKLSDILGSADTQIFYIGKATWGNGEYMNGMVDDISVYGIAPITDIENKNITDTLVLPKAAADAGYSIKWTSDNTDVISIDDSGAATVTLPTADTSVTLTAQITYGDITISKDINVTVQGQTALTVTVDSDAADNVSVDKTEAHLGDEINVTVTAPEGKVIKDVKAGDTSILTSGRKGAYKFNMPSTNVTVTAEFEDKKQTAVFRFEDDTADGITYLRDGSAGTMEFAAGKTGNALKLTPSAKNGYYGKLDKFPLALSFSVGAWIKPADMNTWWQRVFDFGIGENNSIFVTTLGETPNSGTSGTYRVDAFGSGIDSPKKLTANEWAYITVTYDEASDTLTLYLNGESVGTAVCTKNMAEVYSGTANYIGKSQYAADALYNGLIDEMVIYNYAITADEIKTLMGTEAAPTNEPTSTPTSVPTDAPTSVPTDAPTSKPTSVPTNAPTSKPTDAPTSTPTLKPTDTPSPKYAVSGTITNADNTAAKNVKLTLKPTDAHTLTDENGFYAFSDVETGIYNLIVEYDDKTITMLIKVENKDVVIDVNLPATGVSSALEVKGENTPDIIVGGLDKLADEIAEAAGRDAVTEVKMTVESKPENTADPAQKAIKKKSGDSKIEYIDIVIVKTVDNETEEISKTGNLITIVIPFATEGKSNIRVYRYHGGKAESMSNSGSGERCEVGDGFVTIYAQKFSTYAIAYDEKPQSSTEPTTKPVQGSTSSHSSRRTSTTPSPKPTATPEATEEPVSSEAPIESSEPTSAPLSPDTLPFDDVHSTDWFYDAVKFAYDNGLMNGVAETEFGPGMTLTRGMLVTILGRMDGAPQAMETNEYTDIDRNAYYAPYVAWGTANGILNGFGDGTFRPDEAVTREQTAKIIKCYYDCKGEGPVGAWAIGLDYSDTDRISDWAAEGVMFCAMKGIMTGRENGTFDPKANITRAEFAVTISRID
ncbi:MAG: S-layer homology domain-containing protein, partial [Oscillospiraceae bacterium]|nr:S-layer homology domain-containing protein [Oscillospiraceae bacterium]